MTNEDTLGQTPTTTLGGRIRQWRLRRNLTQSEVAKDMKHSNGDDFSVSYVSAVERGQIKPSLEALEQFAAVLRVSTATLLSTQHDQEHVSLQSVPLTLPSEEDDFEQSIILLRNAHKALSGDLISRALQLAEEAVRHLKIAKEMSSRGKY